MASKIITIVFVLCVFGAVGMAGGDSMSIVTNRLMLEGYTDAQINEIKTYPDWPAYDFLTGELVVGPQKWISPNYRMVVIVFVGGKQATQTITRKVLYDYSPPTEK